jgi:hypothetical protein
MSSSLWAMTVIMALGGDPYGCPTGNNGGLVSGGYSGGVSAGGGIYSTGMGLNSYSGSNCDTLFPYDSQEAWIHGYFQEIGPYPGSHYFRPYNYRQVLPQVDLANRWGQPQGMPYSQQWWHRYHSRAALNPTTQAAMDHAQATSALEMARQRAWRDSQAEQQRIRQTQGKTSGAPFYRLPMPMQDVSVPVPIDDPAVQADFDQQSGRTFVVPAAPVQDISRRADLPRIPEDSPQFGPTLR